MTKKFFMLLLLFILRVCAAPKVAVIIVVDAFAQHYISKLESHLHYGIHTLLDNGVVYAHAFYPDAVMSTAVHHTNLGTGAVPAVHGVVANEWYTPDGRVHNVTVTSAAREIMAPALAEKFLVENKHNKTFAISLKDRAALGMVGAHVPAIWFDIKQKEFVAQNSDPVINELLTTLNERISNAQQTYWQPAYNDKNYYNFDDIDNYEYAAVPSLFLPKAHLQTATLRDKYLDVFLKMPEANKMLLDGAYAYINSVYKTLGDDGSILVWISLSSLDILGHLYGPYSREIIDMIYHLDKQIGSFMDALTKIVGQKNILYVLTADHGMMPIVELAKKTHPHARRIMTADLIKTVNEYIQKTFGINAVIRNCEVPHVYLDQQKLEKLSSIQQNKIKNAVQKKLASYPGIEHVFDTQKLLHASVSVGSIAWHYKNNIYIGRSGDFMFHVAPYSVASEYKTGTSHYMAQPYDMHVPLILYQPGVLKHKTIKSRVWVNQLTATLAHVLGLAHESYMFEPLPV